MLEHEMETAVASCPDLFIEPGLQLIKRQMVIAGRRPDLVFSDAFSRHLLVELQQGRLDEPHVQRHFYYFFDYRAKFPSTHLRLMFIANRIVPQHKEFFAEHGYEWAEFPEQEFERRLGECNQREGHLPLLPLVPVDTPGVLPASAHEILYDIEREKMVLCYKMLLLIFMAELTDSSGCVPLRQIAEKFQEFFVQRALAGKKEENPNIIRRGLPSRRSVVVWERTILNQPVRYLTERFVTVEGHAIRWGSRIWANWSPTLQQEIRNAAFVRLKRYFNRHVPGGY